MRDYNKEWCDKHLQNLDKFMLQHYQDECEAFISFLGSLYPEGYVAATWGKGSEGMISLLSYTDNTDLRFTDVPFPEIGVTGIVTFTPHGSIYHFNYIDPGSSMPYVMFLDARHLKYWEDRIYNGYAELALKIRGWKWDPTKEKNKDIEFPAFYVNNGQPPPDGESYLDWWKRVLGPKDIA